jgi:predicted patatin/cPLA2 family phospholipase
MQPRSGRALTPASVVVLTVLLAAMIGCAGRRDHHRDINTPVKAGMNTNDLVDLAAQHEADTLGDVRALFAEAEKLKKKPTPEQLARRRSVLCLSGGGSYGAYSAGVLCGWTASGDRPGMNGRPNFAVVTGISTGALIAPFAFLGPQYDDVIQRFYTTVTSKDIYRLQPVRGLFSIALADNAPLERLIDSMLTQQIIDEVAEEHRKGRRLYIGTTELEAKRFVCWDLGEIACRGCPGDRELIKKILMGTSAIPGFFPPSKIPVTVDGRPYVELHGDGGSSTSIFFRPPYVPPDQRTPEALDLAGVDLYLMDAGKLYADAEPLKKRSLAIAATSVSSVLYAGTRADLQRYYLVALLNGMNYHLAVIPPEFPAPTSSTAFEKEPMTAMFNEGFSQALGGTAWRRTPPGVEAGESMLQRSGTTLTYIRRGPSSVVIDGKPVAPPYLAPGPLPVPVPPYGPIK